MRNLDDVLISGSEMCWHLLVERSETAVQVQIMVLDVRKLVKIRGFK